MIGRVLTVCEGNLCRSPYAAALLAVRCPMLTVASAGTHALAGRGADPQIRELAHARGIDLGAHVASLLRADDVRAADLILVMSAAQRAYVETRYPFARGRVFRLADHEGLDIDDPWRRHRAVAERVLAQIEQGVEHWRHAIAGRIPTNEHR